MQGGAFLVYTAVRLVTAALPGTYSHTIPLLYRFSHAVTKGFTVPETSVKQDTIAASLA